MSQPFNPYTHCPKCTAAWDGEDRCPNCEYNPDDSEEDLAFYEEACKLYDQMQQHR